MNTRTQLMQDANAAADQMIADLNAPAAQDTEIVEEVDGALNAEPTTAIEEAPVDTEAEPIEAAPIDTAPTGDELATLQSKVSSLTTELGTADQRYRTLQGMLEAGNQEIKSLRAIIAALGTAPPAKAAEPVAVSDKDKETFGEDLIDLVVRIVRQEVAPMITEVDTRVTSVASVAANSATRQFDTELAEIVPDWEVINDSSEFVAWLGKYQLQALNAAYAAYDLQGTAKFFLDFKRLTAPPVDTAPAPAAAAPVVDKLAHLTSPAKSKAAPPKLDTNGKIWSGADVAKLYRDHADKKLTTAEFNKLEADLFAAQRTGRIAA